MRCRIFVLLLLLALLLPPAAPAAAQVDVRCFAETGFCISGPIRSYWERNGGLPIFGYPIGPLKEEEVFNDAGEMAWRGPVQWFERDRLEDHGSEGVGVLAGRLGAEQLRDFSFQPLLALPGAVDGPPAAGCRYFPQTRHSLCAPYLQYWERNGGLMRFGYPLSEPFAMTMGAWSGEVQYFERRRLERHSELRDAPVLLGLLGREQREQVPSAVCPVPVDAAFDTYVYRPYRLVMYLTGCPLAPQLDVAVADQQFERGVMVWTGEQSGSLIYTINTTPLPILWKAYSDRWREGEPESAGLTPPPGLREPMRGFGKVWREEPGVRDMLGWAVAAERGDRGIIQRSSKGGVLIYMQASNFIYIFGPNSRIWAFPAPPR